MTLAALVVVLAGVRVASRLVLTVLLALFVTLMVEPLARRLGRLGLNRVATIAIVLLSVLGVIAGFGLVLNHSIGDALATLGDHADSVSALLSTVSSGLAEVGLTVSGEELGSRLANEALTDPLAELAGTLFSLLTDGVFITVMVGFMLAEAGGLQTKIDLAFGRQDRRRESLEGAVAQVRRYVWIKTLVSIATGIIAGIACWIAGIDAPLLWGLVAFGLNYIPMVGSLIAALPPVLLALGHGPFTALGLGLAYLAINMVMAEIIEPLVLADRIGLSPAAILVSLLFWGWVLGPAGLLLAVPFTMVLVAYCDYSGELSWLSTFLSSRSRVGSLDRPGPRCDRPPAELIVDGPARGTGVQIAA